MIFMYFRRRVEQRLPVLLWRGCPPSAGTPYLCPKPLPFAALAQLPTFGGNALFWVQTFQFS